VNARRTAVFLSALYVLAAGICATAEDTALSIPRITNPPKIEDFESMAPNANMRELARADDFI